ncbi:hypothetical protein BGW36DRAFT_428889 [Talaromyces proteolyticus]|uniref:Zn(2)-C6 fungal-type domain-containing protein n=1 Tax=Talaromyces proteolyticus TaxID=1131652 RepID=A0AAD4PYB5_9EURO|nr:uncharacterized protein BGW36DRAFT_428889 [Talaromyces proteolyticus]KAH8694993.1 hypothetical protein BGW36DRAFT_428889 [Talaromyces proteolyticus]
MDGYTRKDPGTGPSTQKLKDSCDMCSASKIRCDKQKPRCGRCIKLNYPCFYSPARRMGNSHRRKANTTTAATTSPHPDRYLTLQPRTTVNGLAASSVTKEEKQKRPIIPQTLAPTTSAANTSSGWYQIVESVTPTPDISQSQALDTRHISNNTTVSSTSTNLTAQEYGLENINMNFNNEPEIHDCQDCAVAAMNLLLRLEGTKVKLHNGQGACVNGVVPEYKISTSITDAAIETVAAASKSLSAILVCPCSEDADVGLLTAAVCLSMLDIYNTIIGSIAYSPDESQWPRQQSPSLSNLMSSLEDYHPAFGSINEMTTTMTTATATATTSTSSPSSNGSLQKKDVAAVRVLVELTKVARICLHFTKRYWDCEGSNNHENKNGNGNNDGDRSNNNDNNNTDFLHALANLLRSRLQSITADAVV